MDEDEFWEPALSTWITWTQEAPVDPEDPENWEPEPEPEDRENAR
jgi:hypothetical protein